MTQEQKAKAYDEAIERARALNDGEDVDVEAGTTIWEYIFPELKESEDEKIRNEIIIYIGAKNDISLNTHNRWLAWLEKQTNTKVKDFSENREDLSEFYKQVCRMAASLLNKEYDYTMETVEWYAYTLLEYAKKELEKQCEQKPTWTKEDENCYNEVVKCIEQSTQSSAAEHGLLTWLKSLRLQNLKSKVKSHKVNQQLRQ